MRSLSASFAVLSPLTYLVGFLDRAIRMPEFCYYLSFVIGPLLWWSLIAWLITEKPMNKWRKKGL